MLISAPLKMYDNLAVMQTQRNLTEYMDNESPL